MRWLLLVVAVECAGIVACSKIPGMGSPPASPIFNVTDLPDGHHIYELRLKDGTHCVTVQASITCDWNSK